jgi:hypothetical protein
MTSNNQTFETDNMGGEVTLDETPPPGDIFGGSTSDNIQTDGAVVEAHGPDARTTDGTQAQAAAVEDTTSTQNGGSRNSSEVELLNAAQEDEKVDIRLNWPTPAESAEKTVEESGGKTEDDKAPKTTGSARLDTKEVGKDDVEEPVQLKMTSMLTDDQSGKKVVIKNTPKYQIKKTSEEDDHDVINADTIEERERRKHFYIGSAVIVGFIAVGAFAWYRLGGYRF